ncbi:MAG: hypothetical protein ACPG4W_06595 [Flavobacteriales bacterium]
MIFNPGSFWIYEDNDGEFLTLTLQDVEEGIKDANEGDGLSEYRIETYWDSQKEQVFYRRSTDSLVDLLYLDGGKRDSFKYTWRYGDFFSNLNFDDYFYDNDFFILNEDIGSGAYTKTVSTANFYDIDADTGLPIPGTSDITETTGYQEGIGMISYQYVEADSNYSLTLKSYYIQP